MWGGLLLAVVAGCAVGAEASDMEDACGAGYRQHAEVSGEWMDGMTVYLSGDRAGDLAQKNDGQATMDEAKATWTGLLRGYSARDVTPTLRTALADAGDTVAELDPPFADADAEVSRISTDWAAACAANNTPVAQ